MSSIILKFKLFIAKKLLRRGLKRRFKEANSKDLEIILFNVPSHGNLGDHLIAVAEKQLIKDVYNKAPFVLTTGEIESGIDIIREYIPSSSLLLLTGGGFLGSVWPAEEHRIRNIIRFFPDNEIIFLPQSIYYDADAQSQKLMSETAQIYNAHPNLKIFVRDEQSYKTVLEQMNFPKEKLKMVPDMALYLSISNSNDKRENTALLCLRTDKEKLNSEIDEPFIKEVIGDSYIIKRISTYLNYSIAQENELCEVKKIIEEYKKAKLVITDRLHGMLYGIITGTPVIVFNNRTNKIKMVYENWLKDIISVRFVDSKIEFKKAYEELSKTRGQIFDNSQYKLLLQQIFSN